MGITSQVVNGNKHIASRTKKAISNTGAVQQYSEQ